jgi:hypothetical protein
MLTTSRERSECIGCALPHIVRGVTHPDKPHPDKLHPDKPHLDRPSKSHSLASKLQPNRIESYRIEVNRSQGELLHKQHRCYAASVLAVADFTSSLASPVTSSGSW